MSSIVIPSHQDCPSSNPTIYPYLTASDGGSMLSESAPNDGEPFADEPLALEAFEVVRPDKRAEDPEEREWEDFAELMKDYDLQAQRLSRLILELINRLRRGLDYLRSFMLSIGAHKTELTESLRALVREQSAVLDVQARLVQLQEEKCQIETRMSSDERTQVRFFTPTYERSLSFLRERRDRLDRVGRRAERLTHFRLTEQPKVDLVQLRLLVNRYEDSIQEMLSALDRLRDASGAPETQDATLYESIQAELRQGNVFQPFRYLSFGQKCGIILRLVMRTTDPRVLILDQPEDHLDTHSIIHIVAPALRRLSACRQLILATHNSSLLLELDPERIAVLEPMGERGRLRVMGNLTDAAVAKQILDIVEGGSGAFQTKLDQFEHLLKRVIRRVEDADIQLIENAFRRRSIDNLRNVLQAIVADHAAVQHASTELSMAAAARHELRGEFNQSQVAQEVGRLRELVKGQAGQPGAVGEICKGVDLLLDTLLRDMQRFQQSIEEIRLLDTNPNVQVFDLFDLLSIVREEFVSGPGGRRRRTEIHIDGSISGTRVRADKNHMHLVFRNLLQNSLRSTEKCARDRRRGGRASSSNYVETVWITRKPLDQSQPATIQLRYSDNGGGMPETIRTELYRHRVTDQPGDHGLGGVIIKKLLSINSGNIEVVESTPEGTTQDVMLPLGGS